MKKYTSPQMGIYHFITEIVTSGSAQVVNDYFNRQGTPQAQRREVDWDSSEMKQVREIISFQ